MFLLLLFIPLLAVPLVWLAGERFTRSAALLFSLVQTGLTLFFWGQIQCNPEQFIVNYNWIQYPSIQFYLTLDGLSYLMLVLTNGLFPFIVLAVDNQRTVGKPLLYALMFVMLFAMNGVFMAMDGFLY